MIELLTADTPNGKKISIMLEEIKFNYKITKINILKGLNETFDWYLKNPKYYSNLKKKDITERLGNKV